MFVLAKWRKFRRLRASPRRMRHRMRPIAVSRTVDAPRERVFEYLSDVANHAEFSDHYLHDFRLERLDSTGLGAAASWRMDFPARTGLGRRLDHRARSPSQDRARGARRSYRPDPDARRVPAGRGGSRHDACGVRVRVAARQSRRSPEGVPRDARLVAAQGPPGPAADGECHRGRHRFSTCGQTGGWVDFRARWTGCASFGGSPPHWPRWRCSRPSRSPRVERKRSARAPKGEFITVGEVDYQVQLTRLLNPEQRPDDTFVRGQAVLPADEAYLGVFLRIENDSDEPYKPPRDMKVIDTQGNEYLPLDTGQSGFGLDFGSADPSRRRGAAAELAGVVQPDLGGAGPVPRAAGVRDRQPAAGAGDPGRGRGGALPDHARRLTRPTIRIRASEIRTIPPGRSRAGSRATRPRVCRPPRSRQASRRASRSPRRATATGRRGSRRARAAQYQRWPRPPRAAISAPTAVSTRPAIAGPNGLKITISAPIAAIRMPARVMRTVAGSRRAVCVSAPDPSTG